MHTIFDRIPKATSWQTHVREKPVSIIVIFNYLRSSPALALYFQ
ncbi:hypothetical protein BMETH_2977_0 [methanotrophic bacterial endosymbiont of Bathymodiolus sp.]|nr:hypothetical protein BMETH_2977_0 [methanotrophic bacterial endosymbiont of Bathymodiolus sp.]